MTKGQRTFGVIALGCAGLGLLYVGSWVLYAANYRESDTSDSGYESVSWVLYLAAILWVGLIVRWLSIIGRAKDE